jgi:hypothetical protein
MDKAIRRLTAVVVGVVLFGAAAGTAWGADGYGAVAGQRTGGGGSQIGSTLPFTGMDLVGYVAVATAITVAGLALRAIAARNSRL